jgi:hypothetical protein
VSTTATTNGHPVSSVQVTTSTLTNHPKTATGKVVGGPPLPLPLHDECFKIGFEAARASLSQQARPEDEVGVEKLCRAMGRQTFRQVYDPVNDVHDKKVEAENQRNEQQRDKLDDQIDYAAKAVREAKREKASLLPADKPAIPLTIMFLAALLIAASLSPTFSDFFFFTVSDDPLRWFYSIGAGALIGFTISWAALRYVDVRGEDNASRLLNGFLIGAFLLALALGGIRLANAATDTAVYFALALTGMELAIFVILEFLARGFRAAFRRYQDRKDAHSSADRKIEGASEHHTDVLQQRTEKQAEIDAHCEYVEWRKISHDNIDRIEDAAVESGLAGYRAGIAENYKERVMP